MDRRVFACRVDVSTPELIDLIAKEFKCCRINGQGQLVGATGVLLDKIAQGEIKLVYSD